MHQMIELHPRPDALVVLGLPAIPYPVALQTFQAAVANDSELPLADMLHGLQLRAAHGASWLRLEPAMARLSELLAGDDVGTVIEACGDGWRLEIGPVDVNGAIVAIERDGRLLAALADRGDGGLRLAAFRPLDGSTIALLLDLAGTGDEPAGSAWQRVLAAADSCRTTARDEATPFLVARAAGSAPPAAAAAVEGDGAEPRPVACVAAELATWDAQRAVA